MKYAGICNRLEGELWKSCDMLEWILVTPTRTVNRGRKTWRYQRYCILPSRLIWNFVFFFFIIHYRQPSTYVNGNDFTRTIRDTASFVLIFFFLTNVFVHSMIKNPNCSLCPIMRPSTPLPSSVGWRFACDFHGSKWCMRPVQFRQIINRSLFTKR